MGENCQLSHNKLDKLWNWIDMYIRIDYRYEYIAYDQCWPVWPMEAVLLGSPEAMTMAKDYFFFHIHFEQQAFDT